MAAIGWATTRHLGTNFICQSLVHSFSALSKVSMLLFFVNVSYAVIAIGLLLNFFLLLFLGMLEFNLFGIPYVSICFI